MTRGLSKLLAPLRRRLQHLVLRCVVRLVDDSTTLQGLQITLLAGETADGIERFQQYGLSAHPHPGAEGVALAVGAKRTHTVVLAVDDRRYRLTGLAEGEVALYDDLGQQVHLTRTGIELVSTQQVTLTTPSVHCTGNVTVDGDVVASGISLVNHTHPGDSGGVTGPPQ